MAETSSRVYDLTYPSPVRLKEISAIALVAELWRKEIASNEIPTWDELKLANDMVLNKITPNIPSTICDLLVKFITKFRVSITHWIEYHSINVLFDNDYNSYIELLNKFHDFVWDWNSDIHYIRTAKRMMLCDQFTAAEKFKIACWYCFEDDIEQIWPFASLDINLAQIDFYDRPLPYYWICCLRNELHNIPNPHVEPIDELMLDNCERGSFSSLEYFWNRIPYESRSQATISMSICQSGSFVRFILPRLDDFQLEEFLSERGVDFMFSLMIEYVHVHKMYVLPAWMCIRNKISSSQFIELIQNLLIDESNMFTEKSKDEVYLCCEVWKNSPENLKRSALNDLLLNERLFNRMSTGPHNPRQMRFLITVLLDASFEQRQIFWCKNWRNLIAGARVEDLQVVMKLCFCDENDISSFKEQCMSKYENIGPYCVEALKEGCFEELSEFLYFCYSDKQNVKELKQQLLESNFLGENSILRFHVFLSYYKELNAFVEDAFEDVDLRAEFKNQFVSSPVTENHLSKCIRDGDFGCLIGFVETFVPEERVYPFLKQRLLVNSNSLSQ